LPRIAIKSHGNVDWFFEELDRKLDLVVEQLLERLEIQSAKKVRNFPFLFGEGIWIVRTWYTWDQLGKIPKPVRIGRKLFWRHEELLTWIDADCPPRDDWIFRPKKTFEKLSQ